jgi:Ca-activated chloride channel family protein
MILDRARTTIALGAASATVIAALLLAPGGRSSTVCEVPSAPGGLLTARLASGQVHPGEQHVAVSIQMPQVGATTRPPLSLAIVIDRSGSMEGEPLSNAKAAAARLVDQLGDSDAFTVVTYSSSDEIVMPMVRASQSNKAAAREKIMQIWDDGNTCISCGLERGAAQLMETPVRGGVRRMVLISDGQANTGLYDRGELAQLATETAARGMSISTVGVGLDFDEVTMMNLADVGHGNYYFVEDTAKLGDMFARELSGLGTTVAADARLVIDPAPGVFVEEAYGYQMLRQGNRVVVSLPDLRADKPLKVVFRTTIAAQLGARDVASFELHWRRVSDGGADAATTTLKTIVTNDASAVAATIDTNAMTAIEQARTARVLEDATTIYERDGYEAAQRVLDRHRNSIRMNKNIAAPAVQAIESKTNDAIVNFGKAPATKAKKAARADAYELAR